MIASKLARDQLQRNASQLGFSLFGIAQAQPSPGFDRLIEWLKRGYAGTMSYIQNRSSAYEHPNSVLAGCKSVVMLAMPYAPNPSTVPRKAIRLDDQECDIETAVNWEIMRAANWTITIFCGTGSINCLRFWKACIQARRTAGWSIPRP